MCIGENTLDSGEKCGRPSSSNSRSVNKKYPKIRRWPWTVSNFFLFFYWFHPPGPRMQALLRNDFMTNL